jgi:RNA polymerase sigma-70 factor (ECF subfamily)
MDRDDFCALYTATARPLRAYIRSCVQSGDTADELTQEAFMRLLATERLETMSEDHRRHYLFRIATNLVHDHYRAARHRAPAAIIDYRAAASRDGAADRDLVSKTFEQLRPEDRQLLWLAYVEGASHREIAAATGYTVGSVRPLLHQAKTRALKVLRGLLSSGAGPEKV